MPNGSRNLLPKAINCTICTFGTTRLAFATSRFRGATDWLQRSLLWNRRTTPGSEKQSRGVAAHGQNGENGRIRKIARDAYKIDPRIQSYKELDEKAKSRGNVNESREKSRMERDRERRERNLIRQRYLAEEKRLMEKAEAEETRRLQEEKEIRQVLIKQREKQAKKLGQDEKKALKKARQKLRVVCEDFNYFGEAEAEQMKNMASLEQLCAELSTEELTKLTAALRVNDVAIGRVEFFNYVQAIERKVQDLKFGSLKMSEKSNKSTPGCSLVRWTEVELQILSNVGSIQRKDRWNGIEEIIPGRTKKDCVAKYKEMHKLSKKLIPNQWNM